MFLTKAPENFILAEILTPVCLAERPGASLGVTKGSVRGVGLDSGHGPGALRCRIRRLQSRGDYHECVTFLEKKNVVVKTHFDLLGFFRIKDILWFSRIFIYLAFICLQYHRGGEKSTPLLRA